MRHLGASTPLVPRASLGPMDTSQLTAEQRQAIVTKLVDAAEYLERLVGRMTQQSFPADDPALLRAQESLDSITALIEALSSSCGT